MIFIKKSFYKVFFFFLQIPLFFVIVSCSDSAPELAACKSTVVFKYKNETDTPDVTFSAFVEAKSDVRRAESFTVESRSNKYMWTVENPYIFSDSRSKWACGLNLSVSYDQKIPVGTYDVVYLDAANNNTAGTMNVFYPEELLKMNLDEAEKFLTGKTKFQVALYDSKNVLIYFGIKKDAWKNDEFLFKFNSEAVKYRKVYCAVDESYVCYTPFVTREETEKKVKEAEEEAKKQTLEKKEAESKKNAAASDGKKS